MNNREALKASKQLKDFVLGFIKNGLHRRYIIGSFEIIETALKALEIIKEKNVDILLVKNCYGPLAYAIYNSNINEVENIKLTKEEFDLLKEWLEND